MPEVQGSAVGRGSPNAEDHREARAQARGEGGGRGEHPHPNSHFMASIHLPTHEHASTLCSPPSLPPSSSIHLCICLSTHTSIHPSHASRTPTQATWPPQPPALLVRHLPACPSLLLFTLHTTTFLSIYLSSLCASTVPSINPSTIHLSFRPPTHQPIHPSIIRPSTRPSSIHLSIIYQSPICPSPKLSPSTSWVPGWGMTPRQVSSLGAGRTKESAPRFSHGPVEEKSHTSRAPRLGPPRPSHPSLLPEATGQDGAPERSGHRPVWPPHPRPAPRRSPGR